MSPNECFVHQSVQTKVIAHAGAISKLKDELDALGCRHPVVLSSPSMAGTEALRQVGAALEGLEPHYETGIPNHSSAALVTRITGVADRMNADCLIAIGGGSVSDTAKAVAMALAEGLPIDRHATRYLGPGRFATPPSRRPKLPIVSVPMTASGAEATPAFAVRDAGGVKLLFRDLQLASRVVIIDPAANLAVPAQVMLTTGMNGLAHCIEGLYSKQRSPLSSALAAHGASLFLAALPGLQRAPGDVRARLELLLAGYVGGTVLTTTGSCIHHAICHVLGGMTGVHHGALNSALLPHAIDFNAACAAAELAPLETQGKKTAGIVRDLQNILGVPTRLRDLGIGKELLESAADKTLHERGIANNPRPVAAPSEVHEILIRAW